MSDCFNYLMYGWLFSPPHSSPTVVIRSDSVELIFVEFGGFVGVVNGECSECRVDVEMLPLSQ